MKTKKSIMQAANTYTGLATESDDWMGLTWKDYNDALKEAFIDGANFVNNAWKKKEADYKTK